MPAQQFLLLAFIAVFFIQLFVCGFYGATKNHRWELMVIFDLFLFEFNFFDARIYNFVDRPNLQQNEWKSQRFKAILLRRDLSGSRFSFMWFYGIKVHRQIN